jgi:hypothetical protein
MAGGGSNELVENGPRLVIHDSSSSLPLSSALGYPVVIIQDRLDPHGGHARDRIAMREAFRSPNFDDLIARHHERAQIKHAIGALNDAPINGGAQRASGRRVTFVENFVSEQLVSNGLHHFSLAISHEANAADQMRSR